jgi:polysaccharide pyruvyl transferase WcaK-like protein
VAFERLCGSRDAALQRLYDAKRLTLGVDPAFRMPIKIVPYQTIKRSVGFVLRPHSNLDSEAQQVLLEFCRSLVLRWQKKVVFVCLALPEDVALSQQLVDRLRADKISVSLVLPKSLEDALQALAQIELLFSMRYHGCVFSEWLHGHYIGLSTDPKVAHHCALYRRPFLEVKSLTLDHLHYLWGQMALEGTEQL